MKDEEGDTGEAPKGAPPAFDFEEVQKRIKAYFKVYDVEKDIRGVPRGEIAAFYIQVDPASFNQKFEALREEMRRFDPNLLMILQHRLGEDVILVARKPLVPERGIGLNVLLLILTVFTTTLSGALFYQSYESFDRVLLVGEVDVSFLHPRMLAFGFLTFSLPLIFILGIHELGHYVVARRHRVRTSLPYFIPVPPIVPIGTFGAFISMREPIPDRKALFDIGASGPLVGFLAAIPVLLLGMVMTNTIAVELPPEDELHATLTAPDGSLYGWNQTHPNNPNVTFEVQDTKSGLQSEYVALNLTGLYPNGAPNGTWRYDVQALHLEKNIEVDITLTFAAGPNASLGDFHPDEGAPNNYTAHLARTVPENLTAASYTFTLPANATQVSVFFEWEKPPSGFVKLGDSLLFRGLSWTVNQVIPVEHEVLTHPTGLAGWVGLLVTGFNLLPAGQLDGGHVARAVLGERMRWASYASIALMFLLSLQFPGWIIMAILIVFLGARHPPPLNDKTPLDFRRRVLAGLVLAIFLLTFVPLPFTPV